MPIQFEISKVESYARALAEKLCNEFFSYSEVIKGEQILKLTTIDQVNLFVIKNLLDKWKEESVKLKSPYFNYESNDIKDALQNLLNKLSQNISIRKEFFKPLLEKAIFDSLYLILKPEGFFSNEFSNKTEVKISELKDTEKYYKLNKSIIQKFISRMENESRTGIKGSELINDENGTWLKENPLNDKEVQQYLDQFSAMLKLELNVSLPVPAPVIPVPTPLVEERKEPTFEKPEAAPAKIVSGNTILNEKFGGDKLTVNDLLKQSQNSTLADKMGKSRIENIKGAISLSQKFLFMNALFKGGNADYENALSEIDQCISYDEAIQMLNKNYASRFNWDFNQLEVREFVEIVERKFS